MSYIMIYKRHKQRSTTTPNTLNLEYKFMFLPNHHLTYFLLYSKLYIIIVPISIINMQSRVICLMVPHPSVNFQFTLWNPRYDPCHRQIVSLRTHRCFKYVCHNSCTKKSSLWQSGAGDILEQKFDGLTKELTITGGGRCSVSCIALFLISVSHCFRSKSDFSD